MISNTVKPTAYEPDLPNCGPKHVLKTRFLVPYATIESIEQIDNSIELGERKVKICFREDPRDFYINSSCLPKRFTPQIYSIRPIKIQFMYDVVSDNSSICTFESNWIVAMEAATNTGISTVINTITNTGMNKKLKID